HRRSKTELSSWIQSPALELFSLLSDECQAQTQSSIDSFVSRLTRRYPRGIAVDVTCPARSIPRLLGNDKGRLRSASRGVKTRRRSRVNTPLMVGKILEPEIKSMIDSRNFGALREVFREWPPADVAEVILDVPEDEQVIIFRVLPHSLAADVFEYLDLDAQQKLLRAMAHEQVVGILNEISPDDRTALLEELPSAAARQLIQLLTPDERRVATALLGYPEDSVGRLMTPDFIAVKEDWTVQQVLDYIREHGQDSET